MYLEERVEQLEQQIEELKAQRQSENYLTPAQFAEKNELFKSISVKNDSKRRC